MKDAPTALRSRGERTDEGWILLRRGAVEYSDGIEDSVLAALLEETDLRSTNSELIRRAAGRAEAFQLDPARANIVRGLSIPSDAKVLEIGAGMGAVTRYLGERAAVVDALEPVAARARVARARTRDLPGVEVFVGDHDDLPAEPCYDLVVVVGVLEYVGSGQSSSDAYAGFLRRLAACLVDGGTLAVAIENRIGVKYLVGAPEDHTDTVFDSIEGYPAGTHARTFSRRELETLFVAAGLEPTVRIAFPDYKLTRVVMDAEGLATDAPALLRHLPSFPSADLRSARPRLADERAVWETFVEAGLSTEVGNSFLVLAGKGGAQRVWPSDLLAVYYSRGRREAYSFQKRVLRDADGQVSIGRERLGGVEPTAEIIVRDGTELFVEGPTIQAMIEVDPQKAPDLLRRWRDALAAVVADAVTAPLDFVPNNVVVGDDGSLAPIDQEWAGRGWSFDRVLRRGVLWLAAHTARRTPPTRWPEVSDTRALARMFGASVGLDAAGTWVDVAISEEADFLAEIGIPVGAEGREDAVRRIAADLTTMVDEPLADLPLGERLPELFTRVRGYLAEAEGDRSLARESESALRGRLADADARWARAAAAERDAGRRIAEAQRLSARATAEREVAELARNDADAESQRARAAAASASAELSQIHRSRAWRLVLRFYRVVDRLAPDGTRRRRVYGGTIRAAIRAVRVVARRPGSSQEPPALGVAPLSGGLSAPSAAQLALKTSQTPTVSVVIPVYGKWAVTAQCLRSFVEHPPTVPFEVVVVDDASPDDTLEELRKVRGVRVVALEKNQGFLGATNAGIEAARGEYVVMLNNDTQITEGWLEALVAAVSQPGVGLAGSKLVYPDGRLQEAGGIIFSNAGGWNYGRYDDPERERYNVARDVDYCSGASIIVRRDLLAELGLLDVRFAPAYYEDVDLAFSVREKGLRVVYEPGSVVIHHEGVSHGTDTSSGVKAYQEINRVKLAEKWAHRLAEHYPQEEALVQSAARRQDGKGTIVVIDDHVPRPDEDAGSVRMFGMLRALRRLGWSVIFIPDNRYDGDVWGRRLLAEGVEIFRGPEPVDQFLISIRGRVTAVIGSRVTVAWPYIGLVRRVLPGVPFLFDTVDLHHLRERREAELSGDVTAAMRAAQTRGLELGFVRAADVTLVVSPTEVDVLAQEVPDAKVAVVPLVHERRLEVPGAEDRQGIVFVGSFAHPPNADAVRWFLSEVFPLVRAEVSDARVRIVGKGVPDDIVAMVSEGVDVLGWLPDLDGVYARSRLAIAPLRYGAGLKGKVAEALSHGVPVVVTRIAAEGMGIEHGESGWVADDAQGFAAGVVELLRDDATWERRAVAGQTLVEESLGVARFEQFLAAALERVLPLRDVVVGGDLVTTDALDGGYQT
jgi:GT2 family glycosyltransferase/2-polyprenyl-3-methyl-5-hydroxy-6-metoxy-1,4-benzoquinol methylase